MWESTPWECRSLCTGALEPAAAELLHFPHTPLDVTLSDHTLNAYHGWLESGAQVYESAEVTIRTTYDRGCGKREMRDDTALLERCSSDKFLLKGGVAFKVFYQGQ